VSKNTKKGGARTSPRTRRDGRVESEDIVAFSASGEVILYRNIRCPMRLSALSFNGTLPEVVELTSEGFGEIALRRGIRGGLVELCVCSRQFSAHLVHHCENSPLQWLRAADVFAALFPYATGTTHSVTGSTLSDG
jgi:predicted LPLAT superfamily acyltransferase